MLTYGFFLSSVELRVGGRSGPRPLSLSLSLPPIRWAKLRADRYFFSMLLYRRARYSIKLRAASKYSPRSYSTISAISAIRIIITRDVASPHSNSLVMSEPRRELFHRWSSQAYRACTYRHSLGARFSAAIIDRELAKILQKRPYHIAQYRSRVH